MRTALVSATNSEDVGAVLSTLNATSLLSVRTYLAGGGTAKDLRSLGAAKRLVTEHEYALAVSGVLFLLVNGPSASDETKARIILWVDEMEDLVYFPSRYFQPFTMALREVMDRNGRHVTFMLNFTFSEPEELPSIQLVLGAAIMERVNTHIVFPPATAESLRDYLLELLAANRITQPGSCPTFPFAADAFELIVNAAASKTPRFLNKVCDTLLRGLASSGDLVAVPAAGIQRSVIESRLLIVQSSIEESRG